MEKFKYDPRQRHQLDAINAVVGLFEGQPNDVDSLITKLQQQPGNGDGGQDTLDVSFEVGAVGNHLVLDNETILQNLQAVQDRNGLEVSQALADDSFDFDIEMETGTGKTYVYLRTILELAKKYNFTKFVILVPSVAIKEGVTTSVRDMREHFEGLYSIPFEFSVYSGDAAEEVQPFATSTSVQIMLMTIQSMKGNKNTRIIHQDRDELNGLRPIDYLNATRPVVIMDEPQNMESELSQSAIAELNPLCTLRYSATHRQKRNVVYRLDPVDAHDHGLVKQVVVADVLLEGADTKPYIRLLDVQSEPWRAKLELVVRNAEGSLERKTRKVAPGRDLADLTGNSAYDNNWRINEISLKPPHIELTNHGVLAVGESIGENSDAIHREMIRETIREHLRKESQLGPEGIKVLSLFFVDKVENYRSYAEDGSAVDGKFVRWFDEIFREERAKRPEYEELLPQDPGDLRSAYFSVMRKKGGVDEYVDSTERGNQRDNDAYDLIMRDKSRLLDTAEPVRFIFSHSALREGWDNPNVFQICALREVGGAVERRQTIGRGLRLPVNQNGERVPDQGVAQLSVIANESYQDFAKHLQDDYTKAGVSIGMVRRGEFSKIPTVENGEEKLLGYLKSEQIWEHLRSSGFIDPKGRVLATFRPEAEGFTLDLPTEFTWAENDIIKALENCRIDKFVKSAGKRKTRTLNKELYASEEFKAFWNKISQRTTYRVKVDRDDIIAKAVAAIKGAEAIQPLRIQVTRANVTIMRGGAKGAELGQRSAELAGSYDLPDIISELQEETSLTRKTIVDILIQSGRLEEFIGNPHDFIQMVKRQTMAVLSESIVDGIQYDRIEGSIYELRELQSDGEEERDHFVEQLYEVKNKQKTDFDHVLHESSVEQRFAELLDSREDIKLFMKLPAKFKVPTPVGDYNPDWAIVKHENGNDRIYMIRETKGSPWRADLRGTEVSKIACGKEHFAAIGVEDFSVSTPEDWNL